MKMKFEEIMETLAEQTGLTHDGGDDERLFGESQHTVYVHLMSRQGYEAMVDDINSFNIKGEGFTVGAWNDCSSYDYWKEEGESGSSNYIQVTAYIDKDKASEIDADALAEAMDACKDHFEHYDNLYEYHTQKERQADADKNKGKVIRVT